MDWLNSPVVQIVLLIGGILGLIISVIDLSSRLTSKLKEWQPVWDKRKLQTRIESVRARIEKLHKCREHHWYLFGLVMHDIAHTGIVFFSLFFSAIVIALIQSLFISESEPFPILMAQYRSIVWVAMVIVLYQRTSFWFDFAKDLVDPGRANSRYENIIFEGREKGLLSDDEWGKERSAQILLGIRDVEGHGRS